MACEAFVPVRELVNQSFSRGTLHAIERTKDDVGRRRAREAREEGLVPASVTGARDGEDKGTIPIWVRLEDLDREMYRKGASFENTLYDLWLDENRKELVLPFDISLHPLRSTPLSINFRRFTPGERPGARIGIPVRAINTDKCEALVKETGWIMDITRRVPVYARGEAIPDYLLMDMRGKRVGDLIFASELPLPEGLRLRSPQLDFPVAKLVAKRKRNV